MSEMAYEQLPSESPKAFEAFCHYRDQGPRRTLEATSAWYHQTEPAERDDPRYQASGQIRLWASTYSWRRRARAWDDRLDGENRAAQIQARRELAARQTADAIQLQNLAKSRYAKLLEAVRADPSRIEDLSLTEARHLYVEAVKLERLARGEPTESIETKLSDDSLDSELAKEVARQLAPFLEKATVPELREMVSRLEADDTDAA